MLEAFINDLDCRAEHESCGGDEEGEDAGTDEDPRQDLEVGVYHVQLIHVIVYLKQEGEDKGEHETRSKEVLISEV